MKRKIDVIFSGVVWTIAQNIVNILYGIISVPFLLAYFGKEEYGLIGLALSVNVYIQLLDMGMTNSNVRFFSEFIAKKEDEKTQRLFSLVQLFYFCVGILNTIILFSISFYVDRLFKISYEQAIVLRNLLWILALNSTFSWISICFDQYLCANELIDWIKKRATFLKILQFIILLVTVHFKLSIELYFFAYIFSITMILPLTIIKTHKISPLLKMRLYFDKEMFLIIFPYAFSIFSFSIFHFLAFNFRPLFLGNMLGPAAVAEFNIMNTIASVVTILSGSFMQVLLPIVTKMTVNVDRDGIDTIIYEGTKYVNILLSVVIFTLIFSINELFTLYVGAEYTSLSKWMILWLLTLLLSHRNVMTSLVFTEKKLTSIAVMGGISMLLAICCYYMFIPKYGVGGVVIGFTVHELIHTLFYYLYFLPKKFQINTLRVFTNSVLLTWLLYSSVCVLLLFILDNKQIGYWLTIGKSCIIIGVLFLLTWTVLLKRKDKHFLYSFIKNK